MQKCFVLDSLLRGEGNRSRAGRTDDLTHICETHSRPPAMAI